jgi:hypothetical protein
LLHKIIEAPKKSGHIRPLKGKKGLKHIKINVFELDFNSPGFRTNLQDGMQKLDFSSK